MITPPLVLWDRFQMEGGLGNVGGERDMGFWFRGDVKNRQSPGSRQEGRRVVPRIVSSWSLPRKTISLARPSQREQMRKENELIGDSLIQLPTTGGRRAKVYDFFAVADGMRVG